jgi:hypothetical protein
VFTRDTNAYFVATLSAVLLGAILVPAVRRRIRWVRALVAGVVLLAIFWCSHGNMMTSKRYYNPLMNVVFKRVLTHRERLIYFQEELGMPLTEALLTRSGKQHSSDDWYAKKSPELEDFRQWLLTVGPSRYQRFLLAHPGYALGLVYESYPTFVNHDCRGWGQGAGEIAITKALTRILFSHWPIARHPVAFYIGCWVVGLLLFILPLGQRRVVAAIAMFLLSNATIQAFIAVHGDGISLMRHAFPVGLLLRLTGFLLLLLACDAIAAGLAKLWPSRRPATGLAGRGGATATPRTLPRSASRRSKKTKPRPSPSSRGRATGV